MTNKSFYITDFSVSTLKEKLICPFRTSLGAHKSLENVLFTVKLGNGLKGYGEAGIATHITGETIAETTNNLKSILRGLFELNGLKTNN